MYLLGVFFLTQLLVGCTPVPIDPPSDDELRADASRTITAVDTNGGATATIVLDATASGGVEGRSIDYEWVSGDSVIASGAVAQVELAPGVYDIELRVKDVSGAVSTDEVVVVVTSPPTLGYTLTIHVQGDGTTTPESGETTFPAGTTVSLLAVAGDGSRFERWTGDIETQNTTAIIVMDRSKSITAEFAAHDAIPRFYLPFAAGQMIMISQGNNGLSSHRDKFAWDFPMYTGQPVLASGAGRVIDVLETSLRNDDSSSEFMQPANFVRIDHGNGLQSLYGHVDYYGVVVEPGQFVSAGQVIAYACDTGQSTGPHLHYEMLDVNGFSTPSGFFEVTTNAGVPQEDDEVTSQNQLRVGSGDEFAESILPTHAFAQNQIELQGDTPPAFFYDTDTDYLMRGRVLNEHNKVCVALVDPETNDTVVCDLHDVGTDGSFEIPFRFSSEYIGRYFLAVISGVDGAEGTTEWSVLISPKTDDVPAPRAVIAPGPSNAVDFLQPFTLDGSGSTSSRGGLVTYQWSHASGPPVLMGDVSDPVSGFSVQFGNGNERVSFQLVVFDGVKFSEPAQIDFLMPDVFFVKRIGVTDTLCDAADECPVYDPPPAVVSFSQDVIVGWVEIVNVEEGDQLVFVLTDPDGARVRTSLFDVITNPDPVSFWRFVMTSAELELKPGVWTGTFMRNLQPEAMVEFRVAP